jgi:hypothetical protein
MDLSPVSFRWKDKRNNDQHFGLIAQEVKEAFENHGINCGMVSHAEHYGLDYNEIHMLTMMMVQQQEQRLRALEKILQ